MTVVLNVSLGLAVPVGNPNSAMTMLGQYCTCHLVLSERGVWYPPLTEQNNRKNRQFKLFTNIKPQKRYTLHAAPS